MPVNKPLTRDAPREDTRNLLPGAKLSVPRNK